MNIGMNSGRWPSFALVAAVLMAVSNVSRGDPFAVNVNTSGGTPTNINIGGSSLKDLGNDLVQTQGKFASLFGQAFDGTLRYGGLNNAALYSQNAAGTSATITLPTTGFTRTFTAANQDELRDEIKDFLKDDGAKEYARFLRSINEQTQIGVTDGNPLAATALLSNVPYDLFGLQRRPFFDEKQNEQVDVGLHFDFTGGSFRTGDDSGSGWYSTGVVSGGFRFNDRVGLVIGGMFDYRDLGGASTYNAGLAVGLPFLIIPETASNPISWQVTPTFLAGASGSLDQAAGGTFLGGSITSSVSFRFAPFTLTVANQIGFLEGYDIDVDDYNFDTDLDQTVIKNGVKLAIDIGSNAFIDGGVSYTNFLRDAAVDGYWTPTVGFGIRFSGDSGLRIAYQGDFGRGFESYGGSIALYFNY